MITREVLEDILKKIRETPDLTCESVSPGVFVVRKGSDADCFNGEVRWSRSVEVNGVEYDIYFGGRDTTIRRP